MDSTTAAESRVSYVEGALRPMMDRPNYPTAPTTISRARLKELFALAYETVQWLESKGLQKGEQCEFREIAERLWWKD